MRQTGNPLQRGQYNLALVSVLEGRSSLSFTMTTESVVLLLASAQSFLMAVLIFQKRRVVYANRFLAMMMFACGLSVLHMLLQDNGFYDRFPLFLYAILGVPFLVPPLHLLYLKYLVSHADQLSRKDRLHFLPAVAVELLVFLIVLTLPGLVASPPGDDVSLVPLPFRIYNWVLVIYGVGYTSVTLHMLNKYFRTAKEVASSLESVRLDWLRYLTPAAMSAWIIFLVENTLMTAGINVSNFLITSISAGIYVYSIGYYGLLKSEVFSTPAVRSVMSEILESSSGDGKSKRRYERSGLEREASELIASKLVELMEMRKPFTDASLTLAQLAGMLSISPHNLSEVINTKFERNFYDFVNGYRIEAVKKDLADPSKNKLNILSIAFDAGFNSKATFNSVFKQITLLTPSEYRKSAAAPDK